MNYIFEPWTSKDFTYNIYHHKRAKGKMNMFDDITIKQQIIKEDCEKRFKITFDGCFIWMQDHWNKIEHPDLNSIQQTKDYVDEFVNKLLKLKEFL
jgi:hypothetical protein